MLLVPLAGSVCLALGAFLFSFRDFSFQLSLDGLIHTPPFTPLSGWPVRVRTGARARELFLWRAQWEHGGGGGAGGGSAVGPQDAAGDGGL
jgi:hypothetical protein